jgi:hypothetical protein
MADNNHSIWTARVSVWHIAYIVLICTLIILFVLLIAPGRINDDAYHNFSFAATITSIVLAVVSIVYSIQSGITSLGHMSRIHDIEESISDEINKFSGIDEAIRQALSPLNQKMGDLQKAQDTITQKQDDLLNQVIKFNGTRVEGVVKQANGQQMPIVGPRILSVVLYAAAMSKIKEMDLPFHEFAKSVGVQARYCEGLLDGLAALNPEKLKVEQGSRSSRKKVTLFDEDYLGTKDYWKEETNKIGNEKIAKGLLKRIDEYYSDLNNQNTSDSI